MNLYEKSEMEVWKLLITTFLCCPVEAGSYDIDLCFGRYNSKLILRFFGQGFMEIWLTLSGCFSENGSIYQFTHGTKRSLSVWILHLFQIIFIENKCLQSGLYRFIILIGNKKLFFCDPGTRRNLPVDKVDVPRQLDIYLVNWKGNLLLNLWLTRSEFLWIFLWEEKTVRFLIIHWTSSCLQKMKERTDVSISL
jgi:hypothetical protein